MATKTLDRGICKWCDKEVEWDDTVSDYFTLEDGDNICEGSIHYSDEQNIADHEPMNKTTNFNNLFEKLNT